MPQPRQREGRIWLWAFLITLFLHGLLLALVLMLRPFEPRLAEAREPEPIAMVFQRPAAPETENQASEQPSTFTELPEDRADQRPENPELLSNVDSRARDRTEGGEAGAMPRLQGQSEAPHVGMTPSSQGAPQASTPVPDEGDPESVAERDERTPLPGGELPVPSTQTEESGSSPEELLRSGQEDGQPEGRRETPRDPRDELLRNQGMAIPQLQRPDKGMQDIFQEEMYNPGGNSALFGDVSLNTLAWPYASWLQRFRRDFVRNWVAPYAYYLGLIHGWTLVELEIDHNGRMLRLDVLGEEGHKSLGQQSVASFKATAPFRPLPPNFPEPTLILRIKLIYPEH